MGWLLDPVVELEKLADSESAALGARPMVMGSLALKVCIGGVPEEKAGMFGSAARKEFECELHACVLEACSPHIKSLTLGGQQLGDTRQAECVLHFKVDAEAVSKRQGLADEGCIRLATSQGDLAVLVRTVPARIPSDHVQIHMHGLPVEFSRQGAIAAVLKCAGYDNTVVVKHEFGGELPAALAAGHPEVVRADVAVGVIVPPADDPALQNLPRKFYDRVNGISVSVAVTSHAGERQRPSRSNEVRGAQQASVSDRRQHDRRQTGKGIARAARAVEPMQPVSFVPSRSSSNDAGGTCVGQRRRLEEPLHPVRDLRGQVGRNGLGHASAPSFPPGFPPHSLPPPREQPSVPVGMDATPAPRELGDPLSEQCMLWLEDYARNGLASRASRQELVLAVAREYPAAWQQYQQSSRMPGPAFRNVLRKVARAHFSDADIDSDEEVLSAAAPAPSCVRDQAGSAQGSGNPTVSFGSGSGPQYTPPCRQGEAQARGRDSSARQWRGLPAPPDGDRSCNAAPARAGLRAAQRGGGR